MHTKHTVTGVTSTQWAGSTLHKGNGSGRQQWREEFSEEFDTTFKILALRHSTPVSSRWWSNHLVFTSDHLYLALFPFQVSQQRPSGLIWCQEPSTRVDAQCSAEFQLENKPPQKGHVAKPSPACNSHWKDKRGDAPPAVLHTKATAYKKGLQASHPFSMDLRNTRR